MGKHSSLSQEVVYYEEKSLMTLVPGGSSTGAGGSRSSKGRLQVQPESKFIRF
jgi:hypothetical protein